MSRLGLGCVATAMTGLALIAGGCGGGGGDTHVVTEKIVKVKTVADDSGGARPASSRSAAPSSSGGGGSATVPDLADERLDVAESMLRRRGLAFKEIGGGTFGIVVRSNWTVCSTQPAAGKATSGRVRLIIDRSCDSSSSVPAASASTGSSQVPDLTGERLDVAEDALRQAGLHYREIGGGTFGIVVRSQWVVCETNPPAGSPASGSVGLVVDREC